MVKKHYIGAGRDVLIFGIAVLLLVLSWKNNLLAAILIVCLFLIRSCFWRIKGDITIYVTGALLGPLAELAATRVGIWTYSSPSFLNIPLWLPFAWGFAAVLFIRIAQNLLKE